MDSKSSPTGSPARSLSPVSQSNDDGPQLTPRSKIKALLADIDGSDTESAPRITTKRVLTTRSPVQSAPFHQDVDNDSTDEDMVVAPRGRLAARLRGQPNTVSKNEISGRELSVTIDDASKMLSEEDTEQNLDRDSTHIPTPTRPVGSGRLFKRKRPLLAQEVESNVSEDRPQTPGSDVGADYQREQEPVPPGHTRQETDKENGGDSDSDLDLGSNRFEALVAKKRAERVAKEAAEEAKRAEKAAKRKKANRNVHVSDADSDDEDSEAGVQLTQKTRPIRKAGKKAMEEMARETQRISRNMQLAHEARTKKKITKESLLQRFLPKAKAIPPASSSTNNSSTPNSEDEGTRQKQTPLTSPDQSVSNFKNAATPILDDSLEQPEEDDDLPELSELLARKIDKGKGRAPELSFESLHPPMKPLQPVSPTEAMQAELPLEELPEKDPKKLKQRPIRVIPPKNLDGVVLGGDPADDLEIVESKVFRVFDNLKKPRHVDAKSRVTLRALARLGSPSKTIHIKDKPAVTSQELTSMLRSKARQQAAAERAEKIKILRSKGVIIQTAEERQKDQMDVEDILEKARREDEELTRKEKEAEKKEKMARGEEVEESSGDEDYVEHNDDDQGDLELSGSEEESANEDGDDEDEEGAGDNKDIGGEPEMNLEADATMEQLNVANENPDEQINVARDEDEENVAIPRKRSRNTARIIDDDSEDEGVEVDHIDNTRPIIPLESPTVVQNPFGPQVGLAAAPMGLTQAFAATMADSQFREGFSQEDSLLQLRTMPSPKFDGAPGNFAMQDSNQVTLDELDVDLAIIQTQVEHDTVPQAAAISDFTQLSEIPDPTQDVGFQNSSPPPARFVAVPQSTIDTVIIPQESSAVVGKRRGLLVRKQKRSLATFSDEESNTEDPQSTDDESDNRALEHTDTAFSVMKKAAAKSKRKELDFDKSKSEAKEMFEEQAMESEDEYAGLGGASDDSEGEEDEEIRRMIDEGEVDVNERKVAAYFAEKEREENEAGISKLYKDINSGALRRKRGAGADFDDLDDSDDDHAARQARKQREFARMRKALLEGDSNIIKIADDPKKMAFLKAIEDRDDLEELEFLHSTPPGAEDEMESQDVVPDSQSENRPPGFAKRKRDNQDSDLPTAKHSTAMASRRVAWPADKKPTSLADIQTTLSFLIEDPDSMLGAKVGPSLFDVSSDIELDNEPEVTLEEDLIGEPELPLHSNPRRTGPRTNNPKFVDRLSLKRQESSRESRGSGGQLAFMDPKFALERSFKPPTLLRKATSSFSNFSAQDENGISTNNNARKAAMEPEVKGRGVGGGSKRSSVNWYAREAERKSALAKRSGKVQDSAPSRTQRNGLSRLLGKSSAWE